MDEGTAEQAPANRAPANRAPGEDPLVEQALRKAAVAWVVVGERPARAVWCMPYSGALWLVTGPGEQECPGLEPAPASDPAHDPTHGSDTLAEPVLVTLRGDHGGRVVTVPARPERLTPESAQWPEVAPQLAGRRLNAPGGAAATVERWAAECAVWRLVPTGQPAEAGATLPDDLPAVPVRARSRAR